MQNTERTSIKTQTHTDLRTFFNENRKEFSDQKLKKLNCEKVEEVLPSHPSPRQAYRAPKETSKQRDGNLASVKGGKQVIKHIHYTPKQKDEANIYKYEISNL